MAVLLVGRLCSGSQKCGKMAYISIFMETWHIMNETEFLQYSDRVFAHIEDEIELGGWDLDCQTQGNVLTIEADDGNQIIVNRHAPNQELWIAAKSGGYHFAYKNGQWLSARDNSEFFAVLSDALSAAVGERVIVKTLS